MTALREGWALAVGTLTILPTRPPVRIDRAVGGRAMVLGTAAAAPVAVGACLVGWGVGAIGAPPTAAGLVTVGLLLAGTRAIHADGLADTVDGLGASWDRARALEVMRRGDVGPMGAAALVLVLLLQAVCLGALLTRPGAWAWALPTVLVAGSRAALTTGTRRDIPAARADGLGEAVAGSVSRGAWAVCWLAVLALAGAVAAATGGSGLLAAGAVLAGAAAAEAAAAFVVRRLGGSTGDVLGALVETAACAMLLVATL